MPKIWSRSVAIPAGDVAEAEPKARSAVNQNGRGEETCTDRVVNQYVHEWKRARKAVADFLHMNHFKDVHSARGKWTWTYPLHEAVKQQDAYMTAKLLMFGANPDAKPLAAQP